MTGPYSDAGVSSPDLVTRQDEAAGAVTATAEFQEQVQSVQRRVDSTGGTPLPGEAPQSS